LEWQTLDRLLTVIRLPVRTFRVKPGHNLDTHDFQKETAMDLNNGGSTLAARGLFLAAALLSFGLSVVLYFTGEHTDGIFVGLWVPSILALGAFLVPRRVSDMPDQDAGEGTR
jgi:hypothetical protein